jgi:hypothetical protein
LKVLAVFTAILAVATGYIYFHFPAGGNSTKPWNSSAVSAAYVGAELKEVDPGNTVLLLSYDLQNNSAADFHFAEAPGTVVMSRLNSDGSLSSQQGVRLSDATFLPSKQRARIELQVPHTFNWPAQNDPAFQDKLKAAVNQTLGNIDEFVLFDQSSRCEIEFPRGWQELRLHSQGNQPVTYVN